MTTMRWGPMLLVAIVIALACAPFVVGDYTAFNLDTVGTFAIVAVGLSLLSGSTGQFSLGHAGFYAIGAFTAGILGTRLGWPFWLDVPAGGLLAAAAGLGLGIPTLHLSGPYLAIATLGFGLLVGDVLSQSDWAGGRTGISLNPALSNRGFFWIILGVLVVAALVAHNMRRGATGRAFVASRESEPAAQASGINVARYRVTAFAISAGYAGIAGALYANWAGYISADSFGLSLSISFLAMIVVGGIDSTLGAIVGTVLLAVLRQALLDQPHLADGLYGAIIIVILLFVPGGLMGLLAHVRRRRVAVVTAVEGSRG